MCYRDLPFHSIHLDCFLLVVCPMTFLAGRLGRRSGCLCCSAEVDLVGALEVGTPKMEVSRRFWNFMDIDMALPGLLRFFSVVGVLRTWGVLKLTKSKKLQAFCQGIDSSTSRETIGSDHHWDHGFSWYWACFGSQSGNLGVGNGQSQSLATKWSWLSFTF